MKLYAPKYYKDFTCIADKCSHSCCIGWEIDVDETALEKYESSNSPYAEAIRKSIDHSGDCPHFRLAEDERCPHLNDRGLCKIILNAGEDHLCHICREHPRFYNYTTLGKEVGLGMSCEEACRIILSSDGYGEMIELFEIDETPDMIDFDPLPHRERLYSILSDSSLPYTEKLSLISKEYKVSPSFLPDGDWREILSSLEYLSEDDKKLFSCYSSNLSTPKELEKPLERALAYFIYRHLTATYDESSLRAALGFCLLCERLLCSLAMFYPSNHVKDLARIISEELEYSEENTENIKTEFLFLLK